MKKLIKRIFNTVGLDICKISKSDKNRFDWLSNLNINTVFDIGANIGQFVMVMKDFLPDARFHCFEPLSSDYHKLVKNTEKMHKIKTYNMALGDFNGKSKIYHHEFSPASSLLKATRLALSNYPYIGRCVEEEISVQKLDDIILSCGINLKPEIFIKIDVQGFEDKVINGGIKTIERASVILIEVGFQELYEGQVIFDDIYSLLNKYGYQFKGIISTSLSPIDYIPLFGDAIFIRKI